MWDWAVVALRGITVLAAAAAGAMFTKSGIASEPTAPDFSNLVLEFRV